MAQKHEIVREHGPHAPKIAWWASFLATLALLAALGFARSAQALTVDGGPAAVAIVSPPDPEAEAEDAGEVGEEGSEDEECETDEEGEEECGEIGDAAEALSECVLSSADATVSASPNGRLQLTIRYTASAPATVGVAFWLRGSKGPLSLDGKRERFSRKGVFRQTENLTDAQRIKAMAAKDFTVQLRPAGAPRYCRAFFDRHLTARHAAHGGLTWSDPETSPRSSHRGQRPALRSAG